MKNLIISTAGIIALASCTYRSVKQTAGNCCNCNKLHILDLPGGK